MNGVSFSFPSALQIMEQFSAHVVSQQADTRSLLPFIADDFANQTLLYEHIAPRIGRTIANLSRQESLGNHVIIIPECTIEKMALIKRLAIACFSASNG